uniref:Uncharacterized protein n=1 Tax=Leptocylindrus danicus TaxID=163516 RepID=A0A7S2L3K4_9STRA|mmetsp:Transcript_30332/g.44639  ORF Transcript_30332/g.44639 Transcript_30332/m.44639 type:complete len:206 (+) Transcript_30332:478-1095(+)
MSLTHGGRAINESDYTTSNEFFHQNNKRRKADDQDEDEFYNELDAADTELHFGGNARHKANPYGNSAVPGSSDFTGEAYRSRKMELEDVIARSKLFKQERQKEREEQAAIFEKLDADFKTGALSSLLQFCDDAPGQKQKEPKATTKVRDDMDEWNAEMKSYLFERRVATTDLPKLWRKLHRKRRINCTSWRRSVWRALWRVRMMI